jgi:hypothetical protein
LPFSLTPDKYIEGKRNQLPVDSRIEKPVEIKQVVDFAAIDDKKAQIDITGNGDFVNYIPANKFIIDVDPREVLSNGTVKEYLKDSLLSPVIWNYTENDAFKGDLAIMDILSTNKWKRPVYISTTVPATQYKGLEKFFVQEGLAYRIEPVKTGTPDPGEFGMIDPMVMYDNLMNKFTWGNAADPSVYLDENNRRMFSNFRRMFGNLGKALVETGDTTRAIEVAHRGLGIVPVNKLPNDYFNLLTAEVLIRSGKKEEGEKIIEEIIAYTTDYLNFVIAIPRNQHFGLEYVKGINMQALIDIYRMGLRLNMTDLVKRIEPQLNKYYSSFYSGNN